MKKVYIDRIKPKIMQFLESWKLVYGKLEPDYYDGYTNGFESAVHLIEAEMSLLEGEKNGQRTA